ncbi:MAG: 4-hydroxythreonine-4-phosphate dehydrogenase PdxA [Chromatiales bacterium]|nr:4-hydroxythreonine-4-phosphate dehydrogenase PdxA [Chromatiales bacterium]
MSETKPRIAVMLGDPSGVGPELVAKLLAGAEPVDGAHLLVVGDPWVLEAGARAAGVTLDLPRVERPENGGWVAESPALLALDTVRPEEITVGKATAAAGRAILTALGRCLALARDGVVDAVLFAPLNKQAMHLAGYGFQDEMHWFAQELGHDGHFGEINVLESLWTSRVTSHVPLADVAGLIDANGVIRSIRLVHDGLRAAGHAKPRIGVAGLNPHAGDGGIFGREEIDVIGPAVEAARVDGIDAEGPFPADTVFVRARDGKYDAVVTMYHDQGQIAMKLMGFERGVTVAGGLPVPICTPAHGTAFDIAGKGIARPDAMVAAYRIARAMGARGASD